MPYPGSLWFQRFLQCSIVLKLNQCKTISCTVPLPAAGSSFTECVHRAKEAGGYRLFCVIPIFLQGGESRLTHREKNLAQRILCPTKLCSALCKNSPMAPRRGGERGLREILGRKHKGEMEDEQPDEDWDGFRGRWELTERTGEGEERMDGRLRSDGFSYGRLEMRRGRGNVVYRV